MLGYNPNVGSDKTDPCILARTSGYRLLHHCHPSNPTTLAMAMQSQHRTAYNHRGATPTPVMGGEGTVSIIACLPRRHNPTTHAPEQ
jgi:hypothetical protein